MAVLGGSVVGRVVMPSMKVLVILVCLSIGISVKLRLRAVGMLPTERIVRLV